MCLPVFVCAERHGEKRREKQQEEEEEGAGWSEWGEGGEQKRLIWMR